MDVVFIHGLNTYGDDDLHIGPLRLWPMHQAWEKALRHRGANVFAPQNLGEQDPERQATLIEARLRDSDWNSKSSLVLLGHSTGGLTARVLAKRLGSRVRAIVTVGTPHHGTEAANFGRDLQKRAPFLHRLFLTFGYDTQAKLTIYELFTPEALSRFNQRYPPPAGVSCAHAACEVPQNEVSWPLRPFYGRLHADADSRHRSDGFIHTQSQRFGERLGPFSLDHFGNLGFFIHPSASKRRSTELEFSRLVDETLAFFQRSVSP